MDFMDIKMHGTITKKKLFLLFKKKVHFKVAITAMYTRIPWELVTDPFGSGKHSLGTSAIVDRYVRS